MVILKVFLLLIPGVGVFLNKLDPSNLELAAIFGFVMGATVIALAPGVGGWIDRTKRLTAALTFLVVQNLAVAAACVVLVLNFWLFVDIPGFPDWVAPALVILLSTAANLGK